MNIEVFLILVLIVAVLADIFLIVLIHNMRKSINDNVKTEYYKCNVNATVDETIPKILDLYVQNVFSDYQAKYLASETKQYITPDHEQKILKEMGTLCADRFSPAMADKLSLFWNYNEIGAVIADKVYLTVVAYVAQNNAIYPEEPKQ